MSTESARGELPPDELMTIGDYQFKTQLVGRWFREGWARGWVQGRTEVLVFAVNTVLDARGVPVPKRVRAWIQDETDLDVLGEWLRRAATVEKAEHLFD